MFTLCIDCVWFADSLYFKPNEHLKTHVWYTLDHVWAKLWLGLYISAKHLINKPIVGNSVVKTL